MKNLKFDLYGFVNGPLTTGFCLPIFRGERDKAFYFQDISQEDSDSVSGFTLISKGYNLQEIIELKDQQPRSRASIGHRVGDCPIFGFIVSRERGESLLSFGTREQLLEFFKLIFENKMVRDKYLIEEIYNLYKDNDDQLKEVKSYTAPVVGAYFPRLYDIGVEPNLIVAEPNSNYKAGRSRQRS